MALNVFRFAYGNEKLNDILSYALSSIVDTDLSRLDMPGMNPCLDRLYVYRGLRFEDEVEFYFLPHGNGLKGVPVDYVVVSDLVFDPGAAGLYTYSEFARGLYAELMKQGERSEARREKAASLIQRYDLQKWVSDAPSASD
jgi:hypothetical protein